MAADSSDRPDTSENSESTCSRRTFLAGAATVAGGTMVSTPAAARSPTGEVINPSNEDTSQFDQVREISREGHRLLAEAEYKIQQNEYQVQQQGLIPNFSKKVDAVKDLGLDPTGNEPVQDKIARKAESGMLIVCPKGSTFRWTDTAIVECDGPFGIVGEGWKTSKHPPGPDDKDAVIFDIDNDIPTIIEFGTPAGLFANFAVDQRGPKQMVAMHFRTDSSILAQDLRTIGPHSPAYGKGGDLHTAPSLSPQTSDGAVVRVNRYVNVGGSKSGTKNSGGMPIVWVGTSHHGKLQLIDCHIENSPDNGLYGGRTPGNTEIYRGLWRNNDVSQARMSGQGSRIDGAEIELDEKNYSGVGTKQGFPSSNGIKWDSKPTRENDPAGGKIVNCDVRGLTEAGDDYGVGSLINVFPTAGAVTIENTRIVCNIDANPLYADEPDGGSSYPPPPQPHRVVVQHSEITGSKAGDGGAISINGRPNSLVSDTCLAYPGASPDDISGAQTSNIGYGKNCGPKQGLSAKKKVGGSGSGLPPVNVSFNGSVSGMGGKTGRQGPSKGVLVTVVDGIFMLLLMLVGMIALFVAGILGAFGTLAAMISGD
jgi:hypothetical protein